MTKEWSLQERTMSSREVPHYTLLDLTSVRGQGKNSSQLGWYEMRAVHFNFDNISVTLKMKFGV